MSLRRRRAPDFSVREALREWETGCFRSTPSRPESTGILRVAFTALEVDEIRTAADRRGMATAEFIADAVVEEAAEYLFLRGLIAFADDIPDVVEYLAHHAALGLHIAHDRGRTRITPDGWRGASEHREAAEAHAHRLALWGDVRLATSNRRETLITTPKEENVQASDNQESVAPITDRRIEAMQAGGDRVIVEFHLAPRRYVADLRDDAGWDRCHGSGDTMTAAVADLYRSWHALNAPSFEIAAVEYVRGDGRLMWVAATSEEDAELQASDKNPARRLLVLPADPLHPDALCTQEDPNPERGSDA